MVIKGRKKKYDERKFQKLQFKFLVTGEVIAGPISCKRVTWQLDIRFVSQGKVPNPEVQKVMKLWA